MAYPLRRGREYCPDSGDAGRFDGISSRIYNISEGYLWEMVQQGNVDIEKKEKDFTKLLTFWTSIYLRKE